MSSLFISYRRSDSPDTVKLLHERLQKRLPRWQIFYDHQSIPPGAEFPELLRQRVTTATAVLIVIGPKWLDILHQRRGQPVDHVRSEIRLALESGTNVVPVVVGNAARPGEADLADYPELLPLLKRNGRALRPDPDFDADLDAIVAHLQQLDAHEAIGATLADKYTLTAEIGAGGMGVVYAAQQKQPVQRLVAVKLIKPGMDSRDVLARFDAERQALAVMDHPNIARVLDAGMSAAGRPFFVMEYVKGVPITQYCDDKKLTPQQRLDLFINVCNAVQHAHQKGIIHRDLKPTNVLVEVIDGKPVPKVIDFGLAKALGHKLTDKTLHTALETRVGTLEYSSPEQAAGRSFDVDTRSDIYSLGVLLYELLTGAPPFTQEELLKVGEEEMRRVIREVEPATPSKKLSSSGELPAIAAKRNLEPAKLTRTVYGDLDWIVMKCLDKEQGRRYETANQVGEELHRFLKNEPVQAGPPSVAYRARKFLRRNRGAVIAATLVVLALVGGVIGTSVGLVMAETAQEAEAQQRQLAQNNERKATGAAEKARLAKLDAERAAATEVLATKKAVDAAEKEREATAIAVKRLKQIEKANALFESIFRDINPRREEESGPVLLEKLTNRLHELADNIDEEAIGDPLTVARLQSFLATTLRNLGDYAKALELDTKARASRLQHLGPDHGDTLASTYNLAMDYLDAGKPDLALPLVKEAMEKTKSELGPDNPMTLTYLSGLAIAYLDCGDFDLGAALSRESFERREIVLGPDHRDTILSLANTAEAYRRAGKLELAASFLLKALDKAKRTFGADHPDTFASMHNLAGVYRDIGKYDLALTLYEETVQKRIAKLSPDHPDTLLSNNGLAECYLALGKLELALPLLQQTLEKTKTRFGAHHRRTLGSMNLLAGAYMHAGKWDQAVLLYEEVLQKQKSKFGPDDPDTLRGMNNLAFCYQTSGKTELALPLFQESLDKAKAKFGLDHPNTLSAMNNVADAYRTAGKLDLAVRVLEDTLKLGRAKLGSDHPSMLICMNNLALAYRSSGRLDLALPLLEETFERKKAKLGPDHPQTLISMYNLAGVYQVAGKLNLAVPLCQETLEKMKSKLGPEHPDTLNTMNLLAAAYQAADKLELALPLYEEAMEKRREKLGRDHPDTLNSTIALGLAYLASKEWTKAKPLLNDYLEVRRKQWGEGDSRYAGLLALFSLELLKHELYSDAEQMLRECLTIRAKTQPNLWTTYNTQAMLGGSLLGQKKYKEAEPLLEEGYKGMKQRETTMPAAAKPRLFEALQRLVQLFEATGNTVQAERWRREFDARKAAEQSR